MSESEIDKLKSYLKKEFPLPIFDISMDGGLITIEVNRADTIHSSSFEHKMLMGMIKSALSSKNIESTLVGQDKLKIRMIDYLCIP